MNDLDRIAAELLKTMKEKSDENTIKAVLEAYQTYLHDRRSAVLELADTFTGKNHTAILAERGGVTQPWTIREGSVVAIIKGDIH